MTELCSLEELLWKFFFFWVFVVYAVRHLNNRRDYRESLKNRSQPFSASPQNNHHILGHLALSHPFWLQGFSSQTVSALESQWYNRKLKIWLKRINRPHWILSLWSLVLFLTNNIKFSSAKSITLHQLDIIKGTKRNPNLLSHLVIFLIINFISKHLNALGSVHV